MSKHAKKKTRNEDVKWLKRKNAWNRSPCGRPPSVPTNLWDEFERHHGKHRKIRLKVRWNEVHTDIFDLPIVLWGYTLEVEYTANGSDWFTHSRHKVSAKFDGDDGNKIHFKLDDIHLNLGYRWRVRAVDDKDGCKSEWTDWEIAGNPGPDEPPAPDTVKILDNDVHLLVTMKWQAHPQDDDDELFDDKINHFQAQLSTHANFSDIYDFDRAVKGHHVRFSIPDADSGDTFYGRVRSVSSDKDKSAWIPAKILGNSNPLATPDGVTVGKSTKDDGKPAAPTGLSHTFQSDDQTRGQKWRDKLKWNEVVADENGKDVDITRYDIDFQSSTNGATWTSDPRRFSVHAKDDDADTQAYKIIHNIKKKLFYRFRVRGVSKGGHNRGVWSAWTGAASAATDTIPPPTSVTVKHKSHPKDQISVFWTPPLDPNDNEIVNVEVDHFQCVLKKTNSGPSIATAFRSDRYIHGSHINFKVPKADQDDTYYAWVRCIDSEGNKSLWCAGTTAGNSSTAATPDGVVTDDGVHIGRVVKHAGNTIPQGYARANGQLLSTSAVPDYFAEVGYTYGGSGSNVGTPDHRRRQARGVGTSQALGDNEGVATETSRDEDHGKHNQGTHGKHKRHKHKHKHRHKHGHGHDNHTGTTDGENGTHHHQPGSLKINSGFTILGAVVGNIPAGGSRNAASDGHGHDTPSFNGTVGPGDSGHTHNNNPTPNSAIRGATRSLDGTSKHIDDATEHDFTGMGPSTYFADTLSGGSDGSGSWDGGETDSGGSALTEGVDEFAVASDRGHAHHPLPDDDDGVRGHKRHPHIRFHFNVKVGIA